MNSIIFDNASLFLKDECIFRNISINIKSGTCHGLIGADNEGKTSLLRTALGYNKLDSGSIIFFEDTDSSMQKLILSMVGFVPDELLSFQGYSCKDFLNIVMSIKKIKDWNDYADMLLDYFKIDADKSISDMNECENKCLYIISAILSEPEILILDEPFIYLDKERTTLFKEWIKSYVQSGKTVLLTGDSFECVKDICDYISFIKDRTISNASINVKELKEYHVIETEDTDIYSIPHNVKIISQSMNHCLLFFDGTPADLLSALNSIRCSDFSVNKITIMDIISDKYPWLEELL